MGEKTDRPVETGAELEAAGVAAVVLATLNALGVGTNAGAGQGTSGAFGSVLGASDQQNKTDVNVPEVLTGMNAMTQKRALAQETTQDNLVTQILQNGITEAHLITTNEINKSDLIAKAAIKHSELATDRIWNPDEVAALFAAYFARFSATLNNPIPPKE
jgi:hypothetical protein